MDKQQTKTAETTESIANLSDQIYHDLWNQIAMLSIMPGEKLSEAGLAREYECSRIPVREAVKRLASEGILDVYPQRGSFVSKIDLTQVTQIRYLREVLETNLILEAFDQGLLDSLLPVLESMIYKQQQLIQFDELDTLQQMDDDFHDMFYHIAAKDYVLEHTGRYNLHYIRARKYALSIERSAAKQFDESRNVVHQHKKIIEAIRLHDRDKLQERIVKHLRNLTNTLDALPRDEKFYEVFKDA